MVIVPCSNEHAWVQPRFTSVIDMCSDKRALAAIEGAMDAATRALPIDQSPQGS